VYVERELCQQRHERDQGRARDQHDQDDRGKPPNSHPAWYRSVHRQDSRAVNPTDGSARSIMVVLRKLQLARVPEF
jgi:hypothetical protein